MRQGEDVDPDRTLLNFEGAAISRFDFVKDLGFELSAALPTIVRYRRDDLELRIYHGRQSFEVGLEVGHGEELFSLGELIRSADPAAADRYRLPTARTAHGARSGP
jgi:hypothetical protein